MNENWLYYSNEYNKVRQASVGEYKGLNIRKNNKESLIMLGDIVKDSEIKEANIKERNFKKHGLVLFHELIHASRDINKDTNLEKEEEFAIDKENTLRTSVGEGSRSKDILETKDIINGEEIILYYDVDIELGSSGAEVEELQQKLIRMGMDLGGYGATGYYGDYTVAAIKAIQQYKGYETVGRYGPSTRGALNGLYAKIDGNDKYPEKDAIVAIYRKNIIGLEQAPSEEAINVGESGPRVVALQEKLLKLGFNLGVSSATGYYGFYTKTAILTIQEQAGLEPVGFCGPGTRARIGVLCDKVDSIGNYPEKITLLSKYSNNISSIELDPGDSGIAVENLQTKLMLLGFDLGGYGVTGYFGTYTSMALMAIQKLYGLDTVGRYGPGTRSKLNELFNQIDVYGDYEKKEELQRIYQELLLDMELDPGQEGAAVEELQKKLMLLGFDLGGYGATGYFGQYTVAALSAIQDYFNLGVVGRYGPATRGKVKELLNKKYNGNYNEKSDLLRLYGKYVDMLNGKDETIDLTGNYNGNTAYYDQEDSRWASIPYKDGGDNIGNAGCGVAAMAIVQSTMKNNGVNPVELARYSMNNGYCDNGTQRSFFADVTREAKYSLNTKRLPSTEIQTVKRLLSDGKHMAIAIMKPGHFTKGGHYIVLSGIETINNTNYFNVLDPHRDNTNYGGDGAIIDDVVNDGRVKAKAGIFTREADEYWVFSTDGDSAQTDEIIEGKLNLEKLGYLGLRNNNWELNSNMDSNFEAIKNKFLVDYGLQENYNSSVGNKNTQLFIWIKQALNGQRSRVNPITPTDGNNNNSTNTEVINVGSVIYNFGLGMFDAAKGTVEGIWGMLAHPINTIKNLGEAAYQLTLMASMQGTSVEVVVLKQIIAAVSEMISDFDNGTLNKKARMIGRLVGEILLCVIGDKGVKYAIEGIQTVAKNSKFINALVQSEGKTALRMVERSAEAVSKLKNTLKYSINELAFQIKRVVSIGDVTVVDLGNGITYPIRESDDVAEAARPAYREVIQGIWKYSGKTADEIADFYLSKVASKTKVTGKFSGTPSEILRAELKDVGVTTPPYSNQAHHIVPEGETRFPSAVEARQILERYGVDVNSASNGVFLPDAPNYPHAGRAAVHRGSHTEAYYKYVRDELVNANVQSSDDVVDILDNIRRNLINGSITPNK